MFNDVEVCQLHCLVLTCTDVSKEENPTVKLDADDKKIEDDNELATSRAVDVDSHVDRADELAEGRAVDNVQLETDALKVHLLLLIVFLIEMLR